MPDRSYMFLFSIVLQIIATFLTKAPEFLAQQQEKLENVHINKTNNKWEINEELSLRALTVHQLIKHVRLFYEDYLCIMRYILFFFIVSTIISTTVFFFVSPLPLINEAVMAFILIFIGFSLMVSLPSIFCFLFSWLIVKSKPEN